MDLLYQVSFFAAGLFVGGFINWGVYQLAWTPRPISPWMAAHKDAPSRQWADRLPVLGWLGLRREASIHGAGFWIRPICIELATAVCFLWLFEWERGGHLMPDLKFEGSVPFWENLIPHLALFTLMMVATFIDFDEKTIPDWITLPGTVLAIAWAYFFPQAGLPIVIGQGEVGICRFHAPNAWPESMDGTDGLWIGIGVLIVWCAILLPFTWTTRRGITAALRFFVASLIRPRRKVEKDGVKVRRPFSITYVLLAIAAIGSVCIAAAWSQGGESWQALLSSLVGLGGGAGVVFAIRVMGSLALKKEAMGLGDVTLLGMIGAVLGWQFAVVTLFVAPFAAIVIGIIQLILTRSTTIAFGPYLCLGTAFLFINWPTFWHSWAQAAFAQGTIVPLMLFSGICLMGGMLYIYRILRDAAFAAFEG